MANDDNEKAARSLELSLYEIRVRVRRYTMDRDLSDKSKAELDNIHADWLKLRGDFHDKRDTVTGAELRAFDDRAERLDRRVDVVQRELVSELSFRSGTATAGTLAAVLAGLMFVYFWSHGVGWLNFDKFEPLAEWGPLKYVEVAFWSTFGALCYLLWQAAYYTSRRDFDHWYCAWYASTALRAPLLSVILMILVLEFTEWYGEGTAIDAYLLEEGNKFYFIAFMSFCLGLASNRVAKITRELSEGVADFVEAVAKKVAARLRTFVAPDTTTVK